MQCEREARLFARVREALSGSSCPIFKYGHRGDMLARWRPRRTLPTASRASNQAVVEQYFGQLASLKPVEATRSVASTHGNVIGTQRGATSRPVRSEKWSVFCQSSHESFFLPAGSNLKVICEAPLYQQRKLVPECC